MTQRIVFMGSPEFSTPVLRALHKNYNVLGIVTQPDRPSGRGRSLTPPPVKQVAIELDLPFIQPSRIKETGAFHQINEWHPDLIVVAAYGQIIRENILNLPKFGCINVHASLLPRWRGAAPIQAAIRNGDEVTGITIMQMDPGLDTGPIIKQASLAIHEDDTSGTLSKKLSILGANLLLATLPEYLEGRIQPQPQDSSLVTYAPMLKKEDGLLDFKKPSKQLVLQVRALNPWPGALMHWKGIMMKIHKAHTEYIEGIVPSIIDLEPGSKMIWNDLPAIQTGDGLFVIDEIQPAGKKSMDGIMFLRGARDWN